MFPPYVLPLYDQSDEATDNDDIGDGYAPINLGETANHERRCVAQGVSQDD